MAQLIDLECNSCENQTNQTGCMAILKSGDDKGKPCGKKVKEGTNYCGIKAHSKQGEKKDVEEGEIVGEPCTYKFQKGQNKGKPCGAINCKKHNISSKGFSDSDKCGVKQLNGNICERINCRIQAHVKKRDAEGIKPVSETLSITMGGKTVKFKIDSMNSTDVDFIRELMA
jgi:hypothetical protein